MRKSRMVILLSLILVIGLTRCCDCDDSPRQNTVGENPVDALSKHDIGKYDPSTKSHEKKILGLLRNMRPVRSAQDAQKYITRSTRHSKRTCYVTGKMVWDAAEKHDANVHMMLALMRQDSNFGTALNRDGTLSKGARTKNPGNVGNGPGNLRYYKTWKGGVEAVAIWLDKHRGKTRL